MGAMAMAMAVAFMSMVATDMTAAAHFAVEDIGHMNSTVKFYRYHLSLALLCRIIKNIF